MASSTPGNVFVTMNPRPSLPLPRFHEWYNNEHGPLRLRKPHLFTNGLRYCSDIIKEPAYFATYDVPSISSLETEEYTSLRSHRSPREAEVMAQVDVKRYLLDLVQVAQASDFNPIENLTDDAAEGHLLLAGLLRPTDAEGSMEEIERFYSEEHIDLLSKVPGWLRSRLFKTSASTPGEPVVFLGLHDYAEDNGLGGPEFNAASYSPRANAVYGKYATVAWGGIFSLVHVFGQGPRDLENLAKLPPATSTFTSADGRTVTTNDPAPVIESFINTPDGLSIPYRLEGNPHPKAPTVAFSNSLLTSFHMWDRFIEIFKAKRPQYRVLRYDSRGRHAIPSPPQPATLDILADDINSLMTALRIPKLEALVGVSIGGATALKFALKYPSKVNKFIACDFNAVSSPANTSAWQDRIAMAGTPLEDGSAGINKLAGLTVERWFHPSTMESKPETVSRIRDMVAANNIEGFRYGCQALWDYDMLTQMRDCEVPGLFVVGDGDGKGALVKAMDGFKILLGRDGADLAVVPETGHLPMCEDPEGFWTAIEKFL
ncbi:Alpha/Beta hydrolase protein [Xylaria sp. CBS 124048]|nr:Alpha/Beta hydrolase protein [Xylaria sp. CBS 124048]